MSSPKASAVPIPVGFSITAKESPCSMANGRAIRSANSVVYRSMVVGLMSLSIAILLPMKNRLMHSPEKMAARIPSVLAFTSPNSMPVTSTHPMLPTHIAMSLGMVIFSLNRISDRTMTKYGAVI